MANVDHHLASFHIDQIWVKIPVVLGDNNCFIAVLKTDFPLLNPGEKSRLQVVLNVKRSRVILASYVPINKVSSTNRQLASACGILDR